MPTKLVWQYVRSHLDGWSGGFSLADAFAIECANDLLFLMVAIVALGWWQMATYPPVRHTVLVAGLSLLIAWGINILIGLFIHRVRPNDAGLTHALIAISPDWSFPSDHAATSAAVAAAFWFRGQIKLALILSVAVVLICVSRVFIGARYVSDVIGGEVIGVLAAFIVSKLFADHHKLSRFLVDLL